MTLWKAPAFWNMPQAKFLPALLSPLEALVAWGAVRRAEGVGWKAPVPVLCCGNITVGGTGKTTVVMDLVARLQARGKTPHVLSRGYGGRQTSGQRVDPQHHTARDVGDEPLLLATCCPVWVGSDRVVTARAAIAAGADCLVMDDGFQNPGLEKTLSLLVVDGVTGLGNGHVLPAGPLRERPEQALARASAVLLIGKDQTGFAASPLMAGTPLYQGDLRQTSEVRQLEGKACVAFAGLGRPEKFFSGLRAAGVVPVQTISYPDHYYYRKRDMRHLLAVARSMGACLVTTPKDAVRLPAVFRQQVVEVGVELVWPDPAAPEKLLDLLLETPL